MRSWEQDGSGELALEKVATDCRIRIMGADRDAASKTGSCANARAEVKNLRNRPSKDEILQIANYLNRHGTGLFALVLARGTRNDAGRWIRW